MREMEDWMDDLRNSLHIVGAWLWMIHQGDATYRLEGDRLVIPSDSQRSSEICFREIVGMLNDLSKNVLQVILEDPSINPSFLGHPKVNLDSEGLERKQLSMTT